MPLACRAELPWQNSTRSPLPAPSASTATMVLAPGAELRGLGFVDQHGAEQEQLLAEHGLVLFGRDHGADDAREEHGGKGW